MVARAVCIGESTVIVCLSVAIDDYRTTISWGLWGDSGSGRSSLQFQPRIYCIMNTCI